MGTLRLTQGGVQLATIQIAREQAGTVLAPGANLTAAYNAAPAGGTLWLQTGLYGSWATPAGTKPITVRAQAGHKPTFRQLQCGGDNVTFDGIHVDANNTSPPNPNMALFETGGHKNITFKNGSIGNVVDQKGALLGGQAQPAPLNIVLENVRFWNIRSVGATVHNEAVYLMAPGTTIQGCRFEEPTGNTGPILTQRGSWWGQQPFGDLKFIGNTFQARSDGHPSIGFGNHAGDIGANVWGVEIRGNVFHPSSMPGGHTPGLTFNGSVESCNTPQVNLPGITHEPC